MQLLVFDWDFVLIKFSTIGKQKSTRISGNFPKDEPSDSKTPFRRIPRNLTVEGERESWGGVRVLDSSATWFWKPSPWR
jgi:hypothetical protein